MSNRSVNDRQLRVLEWIADGSPDGVMTGHAYKNVAIALQGRGLITISKRQGVWQATLTARGEFYVAHHEYPDPKPASVAADTAPPEARTPPQPARVRKVAPTVDLVRRVEELGEVRVEGWSEVSRHRSLVESANRFRKTPPGQQLLASGSYGELVVTLVDAPSWWSEDPAPIEVDVALRHPDPVVAQIRDASDLLSIVGHANRQRALRLLNALVGEGRRRGHEVTIPTRRVERYPARSYTHDSAVLLLVIRGHQVGIDIGQENDRTEHQATKTRAIRALQNPVPEVRLLARQSTLDDRDRRP
jgi:hypothetical protein